MEERKPLVSVIVPVYNVYPYLRDCVQSVQAQSYQNWELLLVDDGSTDGSGELCDELAVEDGRIRVFHKPNGGLSDARNAGLEQAKGEYITFLDSDDLLDTMAIEKLLTVCDETSADVAIGQTQSFVEKFSRVRENTNPRHEVISNQEALRRMFLHRGVEHAAWGKLYRRECWKAIKFPKGVLYEDYATIYQMIAQCRTVVIYYEPLYYYRVRNGSIMHSRIEKKNLFLLDISETVTRSISEQVPEVQEEARYLQMVTYLKVMKGILDGGFRNYPDAQKRILCFVRKNSDVVNYPWAKKTDRIKVRTLLLNKSIFYWVYELGERKNAWKLRS